MQHQINDALGVDTELRRLVLTDLGEAADQLAGFLQKYVESGSDLELENTAHALGDLERRIKLARMVGWSLREFDSTIVEGGGE